MQHHLASVYHYANVQRGKGCVLLSVEAMWGVSELYLIHNHLSPYSQTGFYNLFSFCMKNIFLKITKAWQQSQAAHLSASGGYRKFPDLNPAF